MSGFREILQRLVERVPGAEGAALVAWDGEPVDCYSLSMPALDFAIVGAQWGLVWTQVAKSMERAHAGMIDELIVDGEHGLVLVRRVTEGYFAVFTVKPRVHLARAQRELVEGAERLREEIG